MCGADWLEDFLRLFSGRYGAPKGLLDWTRLTTTLSAMDEKVNGKRNGPPRSSPSRRTGTANDSDAVRPMEAIDVRASEDRRPAKPTAVTRQSTVTYSDYIVIDVLVRNGAIAYNGTGYHGAIRDYRKLFELPRLVF